MQFDLITILGPTASGKTNIASQLASEINGEIISADSRQVYWGMDIGTGKDLIEFQKYNIKYHLINITDPSDEYNLFRFTKDFHRAFEVIIRNHKIPILVGGTGLYLSSILQSFYIPEMDEKEKKVLSSLTFDQLKNLLIKLKPRQHNVTDLIDKDRMIQAILIENSRVNDDRVLSEFDSLTIGIKLESKELKNRITERLKLRLKNGMIEEVKELLKKGVSKEKMNFFGLEYKYVSLFIDGQLNYNDMFQKLNSAIHNYSKRQMTWFRKMEREGVKINWFSPDDYSKIKKFVNDQFNDAEFFSR